MCARFNSSKARLLTRSELDIDWRIFYVWAKLVFFNHDESYSLVTMPKSVLPCLIEFAPFVDFGALGISRIRSCTACEVVVRISLLRQRRIFSMSFDPACVHSIRSAVM